MANYLIMFYISFNIKKIAKFWLINSEKLYLFRSQANNAIKNMINFFEEEKY